MGEAVKQHLIDPEICIRCYTCEMTCPLNAIEHDDNNVVVDAAKCDFCMACIPVCPTGSIDHWHMVQKPYSLEDQYGWEELPPQTGAGEAADSGTADTHTATIGKASPAAGRSPGAVEALLADAHKGAGGRECAPQSAAEPVVNLYMPANPASALVQGNYRLTDAGSDTDTRHIILNLEGNPFPVLEGQTVGIIPPGEDTDGRPHAPRLYSISSPRDGERAGWGNISLTVKREAKGICSNYICDLEKGARVKLIGPFGNTFLMPDDREARLLMICTGTGSAPMRAFTMRRQREQAAAMKSGNAAAAAMPRPAMTMFFGARSPETLPYFGPLQKVPASLLAAHLVFSRMEDAPKEYVQDRMRKESGAVAALLKDPKTHVYICGLRGMEEGVEKAFTEITQSESVAESWTALRDTMRGEGRYHVETY